MVLTASGQTWRKIRCATCSGELVPADLPLLLERSVVLEALRGSPMCRVREIAGRSLKDFKQIAAGEREPGSDDA